MFRTFHFKINLNIILQQITLKSNYKHWIKLISITGSAQILVQALGFVSGILIIRLLPVEEYAWYVLANTMLGTMTVLADGGISQGVLAEGGKVWQDKKKLGVIMATGLNLRRRFALVTVIISTPILLYLLIDNKASWLTSIMIILSLIPSFYATLSDSLLQIVPKLHQNIGQLQKNQLEVNIFRLILIALTIFIFPFAFVVILASGIPRIYGNFKLHKIANQNVEKKQKTDKEVQKKILNIVKRILPGTIYFAINGQIIIWLLTIFGDTSSIAEVGALSRFSIIFSFLSIIFGTIFVPYFSKLKYNKSILRSKYFVFLTALILSVLIVVIFVHFFSIPLLWILGDNYDHLKIELVLLLIASGLSFISGNLFNFNASKSWPSPPYLIIPINLICVIIGVLFFNMSKLIEVLYFNIFITIPPILIHSLYFTYKTKKLND